MPGQRRLRLPKLLVQLGDGGDENVTDNGEAARADLVQGIGRGVPVGLLEIDYVGRRNIAPEKRQVVILEVYFFRPKEGFVAEPSRRGPHPLGQAAGRNWLTLGAEVAVADQVGEKHGLDPRRFARDSKLRGHLPASVSPVDGAPFRERFFAVKEGDPDRV